MKNDSKGEIAIFKPKDGKSILKVSLERETVWLTQDQMVKLFQRTKQNISLHINNIFKEKELNEISVVKESLTTATDRKKYRTKYYNLDVIVSVGYRVKSKRGTQFRIWATQVLKDHIINHPKIKDFGDPVLRRRGIKPRLCQNKESPQQAAGYDCFAIKGYSINERRLKEQNERLLELQKTANLIQRELPVYEDGDESRILWFMSREKIKSPSYPPFVKGEVGGLESKAQDKWSLSFRKATGVNPWVSTGQTP